MDVPSRKGDCHLLRQTSDRTGPKDAKLRGQRGLSIARIEQLSELRRRWQSLNQSLRRPIGERPLTASEMRNDPIPDPCPDILNRLENIREQRVNQTAHLILAHALGLKLRAPQMSRDHRLATDTHGEYQVANAPVDFIVLEDLSRYLSEQGRARSENTRLMKWCHRAILHKLKMLAEVFGLPVLETPAAYSSRFCCLTGVAGFRATEVSWEDREKFPWRDLLETDRVKLDQESLSVDRNKSKKEAIERRRAEVDSAQRIFADLERISISDRPHRTLLAPRSGGAVFVPAKDMVETGKGLRKTRPIQADLTAAVNLALRAVASPACAAVHHRLRTERKKQAIVTREPRRFGKEKVAIVPEKEGGLPKERNSNFFYDRAGVAEFGRARLGLDAEEASFIYASAPALWSKVNDRTWQWQRCHTLNAERMRRWEDKEDQIPM